MIDSTCLLLAYTADLLMSFDLVIQLSDRQRILELKEVGEKVLDFVASKLNTAFRFCTSFQ